MKNNLRKTILIMALLSGGATVFADSYQGVHLDISGGQGEIEGVMTAGGKFRIGHIQENAQRSMSITGDLLDGESAADFKDDCQKIYTRDPRVLRDLPDSLKISGVLFPYTAKAVASLVGHPVENALEVNGVEASLALGPHALSSKAYFTQDLTAFTKFVNEKINVNLARVKAGQQVELDMTGLGPLVCDLLLGNAKLKFLVRVSHQSALPTIFSPLSGDEISNLSKNLIVGYSWDRTRDENMITSGVIVMSELQKIKPIEVNLNAADPKGSSWNGKTFTQLVAEIFDPQNFKPQSLTPEEAQKIAQKLTISSFGTEVSVLAVEPQLVKEK